MAGNTDENGEKNFLTISGRRGQGNYMKLAEEKFKEEAEDAEEETEESEKKAEEAKKEAEEVKEEAEDAEEETEESEKKTEETEEETENTNGEDNNKDDSSGDDDGNNNGNGSSGDEGGGSSEDEHSRTEIERLKKQLLEEQLKQLKERDIQEEEKKRLLEKQKSVVRSFGRGVMKGPGDLWKTLKHPALFLLIVILVHMFDAFYLGFDRSIYAILMAAIYTAIAFFALLVYQVRLGSEQSGLFFILSLTAWSLPFLTNRVFPSFHYLTLILLFTPVWPLYVMYSSDTAEKSGRFVRAVGGIYFALWIILLIILVFSNMIIPSSIQARGVDVQAPLEAFSDIVKERASLFWNKITLGTGSFYTLINKTVNPSTYYYGTVEKNKDAPVGVFLEDVKTDKRVFYEGESVMIYGKVSAKSFLDIPITITPWCRPSTKRLSATPIVEPQEINIKYTGAKSFYCKFDSIPSGIYPVVVSLEFPFETWSYIPLTFVSQSRADAIYAQGKSVNQELDIDANPTSVFTNGPVMLALGGDEQPILVNPDKKPFVSYFIGVTINNQWGNRGKIKSIDFIELKVPKEINLITDRCDKVPEFKGIDDKNPELKDYIFRSPKNTPYAFTTITCPIEINSAEEASSLLSGVDKQTKTMVAVVKYKYELDKKISINVK